MKMKLENFKGIKSFELDTRTATEVRGTNGSGKSTLKDAYLWALTGRDSLGRTDHEIKTREGTDTKHQIDHSVTIQEKDWSVKRTFREDWKVSRGEERMSGHTTEYYTAEKDEPLTKVKKTPSSDGTGGFDQFVRNKLGTEEIITSAIDPNYFPERLHWKKRREIIFEMTGGEQSEKQLAESMALSYPELPKLIAGKTASDAIVEQKKIDSNISKELDNLRIAKGEAERAIPETIGDSKGIIEKVRYENEKIHLLNEEINDIKSGGKIARELKKTQNQREDMLQETKRANEEAQREYQKAISDYDWKIEAKTKLIETMENSIKDCDRKIEDYQKEFYKEKNQEYEADENCKLCGQPLTEELQGKSRKAYNAQKSIRLQEINDKARREMEAKGTFQNKIEEEKNLITQMENLKKEIQKPEPKTALTTSLDETIRELQEAISGETAKIEEMVEQVKKRQEPHYQIIESLQAELGIFHLAEKQKKRVIEIEHRQEILKDQQQETMKNIVALEELIKRKVEEAEDKIYQKFGVRFKMYDRLQNGGLTETCEAMMEMEDETLIPYSTANNAGRILVGLKITEAIQKHYKLDLPVFIDNSESIVVQLPKTSLRTIALTADGSYMKLKQI